MKEKRNGDMENPLAMGYRRAITEKIVAKNVDYIMAVKGHQGHMKCKQPKAGWDHA